MTERPRPPSLQAKSGLPHGSRDLGLRCTERAKERHRITDVHFPSNRVSRYVTYVDRSVLTTSSSPTFKFLHIPRCVRLKTVAAPQGTPGPQQGTNQSPPLFPAFSLVCFLFQRFVFFRLFCKVFSMVRPRVLLCMSSCD